MVIELRKWIFKTKIKANKQKIEEKHKKVVFKKFFPVKKRKTNENPASVNFDD